MCNLSVLYLAKDCQAVYQAGHRRSGVYRIYPSGGASTDVICDMETIGGGWTVSYNNHNMSFTNMLNVKCDQHMTLKNLVLEIIRFVISS